MLAVLSPAKALDLDSPLATKRYSQPEHLDQAAELVEIMRTKSVDDIRALMSISDDLARLNLERFVDWEVPFTPKNARPAVLMFNGDTYQGLDAPGTFGTRDYTHAQKTLRILSGLYGVLRPLDLIQPYRLEMGAKLATDRGRTLYDFWSETVTDRLAADIDASSGSAALVVLASAEYAAVIDVGRLGEDGVRVVTPRFLDAGPDGALRSVGFFAKRARGAMAGWMVRERVASVRALRGFDGLGYRFDAGRSSSTEPVFVRA